MAVGDELRAQFRAGQNGAGGARYRVGFTPSTGFLPCHHTFITHFGSLPSFRPFLPLFSRGKSAMKMTTRASIKQMTQDRWFSKGGLKISFHL